MELLPMCHPLRHESVEAPHVFRGKKSILLFRTHLYFQNVLFWDAQGKLPLGLRNFPSSFPSDIKILWSMALRIAFL